MKPKSIIFLLLISIAISAHGQIAQWLIAPRYDNIAIVEGCDLIVTDSLGQQILWDFNGNRLSSRIISDRIHPFHDGFAVVTDKNDNQHITGFVSRNGVFTPLDCLVANSMAQFKDGYLLTKHLDGRYFQFIGTDGMPDGHFFVSARPFNRGYASCETYENMQKEKDLYSLLLSARTMQEVPLRFGNEEFKRGDINFISSINDEGKGIVVYKEKVYLFDAETQALSLVYASSTGQRDKKDKPVKVMDRQQIVDYGALTPVIRAASDKTHAITITLDEKNAPQSIQYTDELVTYQSEVVEPRKLSSPLNKQRDDYPNLIYSLYWGDSLLVLPSQLDDVSTCFGDKAMIKINGRWGLIKVHPDKKFDIMINDGKSIGFRHKTFKTTIQLNTPGGVGISPENDLTDLELRIIDQDHVCHIEEYSRVNRGDGSRAGFVKYECELDYPEGGFEESEDESENDENITAYSAAMSSLKYNCQVEYHGLRSPIIPFEVPAYHDKYITPDVDDGSYFENSCYYFTLRLTRSADSENKNFPLDVYCTVSNDSGFYEVSKEDIYMASADKYEITVRNIYEGDNTIGVNLIEENTPGLESYFEFRQSYQKPRKVEERQTAAKPKIHRAKNTHRKKVTRQPQTPPTPSIRQTDNL